MTYANVPELPPPRRPTQPQEEPVAAPNREARVDKFLDGDIQEPALGPGEAVAMMAVFDREYAEAAAAHQHMWIANMCYKIEPPLPDKMIFNVSMLRMAAFGCFICEEPYRLVEVGQPCPGEPQPTGRHSA